MTVKIEESWKAVLQKEFDKEYFAGIAAFLHKEKREGKVIYPPGPLIFNAFRLTPFNKVKVVILGQDPYHGKGQAHGLSFSVPKNLYIIGMMNTADRSLAMIDYALRRRFSFFEVEPGFDSEGFIHYQNGLNNETLNELINKVKDLNREITLDKSLGKGFCIGHSYFCGRDVCTEEWLHSIVDYDILPMLSEYWFDDANKLQRWENILQGVFQ